MLRLKMLLLFETAFKTFALVRPVSITSERKPGL